MLWVYTLLRTSDCKWRSLVCTLLCWCKDGHLTLSSFPAGVFSCSIDMMRCVDTIWWLEELVRHGECLSQHQQPLESGWFERRWVSSHNELSVIITRGMTGDDRLWCKLDVGLSSLEIRACEEVSKPVDVFTPLKVGLECDRNCWVVISEVVKCNLLTAGQPGRRISGWVIFLQGLFWDKWWVVNFLLKCL